MAGPTIVAEDLGPGLRDEGLTMPDVFDRARRVIAMGHRMVVVLAGADLSENSKQAWLWAFEVGGER